MSSVICNRELEYGVFGAGFRYRAGYEKGRSVMRFIIPCGRGKVNAFFRAYVQKSVPASEKAGMSRRCGDWCRFRFRLDRCSCTGSAPARASISTSARASAGKRFTSARPPAEPFPVPSSHAIRTALLYIGGQYTGGNTILLTVVGSNNDNPGSYSGVTAWEIRQIIRANWPNCSIGINLDGGGSTQIAYKKSDGTRRWIAPLTA